MTLVGVATELVVTVKALLVYVDEIGIVEGLMTTRLLLQDKLTVPLRAPETVTAP